MRAFLAATVGLWGPACSSAVAAPDLAAGDQLRGFLDFRAGASDGEHSWLNGGYGKTRFGGADDGVVGHGALDGILVWRPHLTWNLDAVVSLQADTQASPSLGVTEAYLSYRGAPSQGWRLSGRAGVFYPPVSLEHEGLGWTPTDTITPSALNSWVGEEVKVGGVEATARRSMGESDVSLTLALFGYNDTAGTLLAMRGWALGDITPGVWGELPLPDYAYQRATKATAELDGRVGYYARLEYRPIGPLTLDVMHYDNAGDRVSDERGQTDWETRFTNLGVRAALDTDTRLRAQVMTGETIWGRPTPVGYWSEVEFAAAYLMLAHDVGESTISGRVDYFVVNDRSDADPDDEGEEGWAFTTAYLIDLTPRARLAIEGLHVSSERPQREEIGLDPQQEQTMLQTSLRFSF